MKLSDGSKYFVVTSVYFGCSVSSHSAQIRVFKAKDEEDVLKYCVEKKIDVVFLREVSENVWNCAEIRQCVFL